MAYSSTRLAWNAESSHIVPSSRLIRVTPSDNNQHLRFKIVCSEFFRLADKNLGCNARYLKGLSNLAVPEKNDRWIEVDYDLLHPGHLEHLTEYDFRFPADKSLWSIDGLNLLRVMRKQPVEFSQAQKKIIVRRARSRNTFYPMTEGESWTKLARELRFDRREYNQTIQHQLFVLVSKYMESLYISLRILGACPSQTGVRNEGFWAPWTDMWLQEDREEQAESLRMNSEDNSEETDVKNIVQIQSVAKVLSEILTQDEKLHFVTKLVDPEIFAPESDTGSEFFQGWLKSTGTSDSASDDQHVSTTLGGKMEDSKFIEDDDITLVDPSPSCKLSKRKAANISSGEDTSSEEDQPLKMLTGIEAANRQSLTNFDSEDDSVEMMDICNNIGASSDDDPEEANSIPKRARLM